MSIGCKIMYLVLYIHLFHVHYNLTRLYYYSSFIDELRLTEVKKLRNSPMSQSKKKKNLIQKFMSFPPYLLLYVQFHIKHNHSLSIFLPLNPQFSYSPCFVQLYSLVSHTTNFHDSMLSCA